MVDDLHDASLSRHRRFWGEDSTGRAELPRQLQGGGRVAVGKLRRLALLDHALDGPCRDTHFTSPMGRGRIASAMRNIVRCDPREGLQPIDRPYPLTPTLSQRERERISIAGKNPVLNFVSGANRAAIAFNGVLYRQSQSASDDRF